MSAQEHYLLLGLEKQSICPPIQTLSIHLGVILTLFKKIYLCFPLPGSRRLLWADLTLHWPNGT